MMILFPVEIIKTVSCFRLTVERITRIAHNLECFTELSKNDQSQLLMENADLLVNLRGAIFFDSKKKGVNQILISMGIGEYRHTIFLSRVDHTFNRYHCLMLPPYSQLIFDNSTQAVHNSLIWEYLFHFQPLK